MHSVTCQICGKRPATTHLTELDGESAAGRQELHLCATCIQRLDLKLESGPPAIATILSMKAEDVGGAKPLTLTATTEDGADERCPHCGLSFGEFGSGKLFGCPHDYTAFSVQIDLLLGRYHGTTRHIGRGPRNAPAAGDDLSSRRTLLDNALRAAVAGEHYEDAARLRDELRRLDRPGA